MLRSARQGGVTLIELLLGLVVLGILASIALPSFSSWIQNSQIRNASDSMSNGLTLARGQAISRNVSVEFRLVNGNSWRVVEAASGTQVDSWSSQEGSQTTTITPLPADADRVTFNPMGRVVSNADGSATLTQLDVTAASDVTSATRPLRVTIGAGGGARMCDPNVVTKGDPRAC